MESIKNRTSIRKYAEKEVSEELLKPPFGRGRAHPDKWETCSFTALW